VFNATLGYFDLPEKEMFERSVAAVDRVWPAATERGSDSVPERLALCTSARQLTVL
jgi:hypothetical protein